jgi:hypothetical protein
MVPAPPDVAGQRPEPLLHRGNKAVERARLTDHRSHLRGRLRQHANLVFTIGAWFLGLNHQDPLQKPAIDQRHAQKRVVFLFARSTEVLESRMISHVVDGHWLHLLGYQPGEPLAQRHPQSADRTGMQAQSRREHHVRSIRLQQIGGAHIRPEPLGNQCHNIHQRIGWLATFRGEVRELFQGQNETGFGSFISGGHRWGLAFRIGLRRFRK